MRRSRRPPPQLYALLGSSDAKCASIRGAHPYRAFARSPFILPPSAFRVDLTRDVQLYRSASRVRTIRSRRERVRSSALATSRSVACVGRSMGVPVVALRSRFSNSSILEKMSRRFQVRCSSFDAHRTYASRSTGSGPPANHEQRTTTGRRRLRRGLTPGSKRPPPPHRCPQQRVGTGLDSDPRGVAGSCRVDVSSFDDRFDDAVLDRVFCRLVLSALLGHFDSGGLPC